MEQYGSLFSSLKQWHSFKQNAYPTTLKKQFRCWMHKSKQKNNDKKKSDTETTNKTEAMTD